MWRSCICPIIGFYVILNIVKEQYPISTPSYFGTVGANLNMANSCDLAAESFNNKFNILTKPPQLHFSGFTNTGQMLHYHHYTFLQLCVIDGIAEFGLTGAE